MINVILWDVDGTLLDFKAQEKNAMIKGFKDYSLGTLTEKMLKRYSDINKKYWEDLEKGLYKKSDILVKRFDDFFKEYHLVCDATSFNKSYQINLGDTICFMENAYEIVKDLKGKIKQYIVTNGTYQAQMHKLTKSGLINLVDDYFISDIVGFNKPNIEFFNYVFEKIGKNNKDEMLIVGDSITSDMQGGVNAKIKCCFYNPTGITDYRGLNIDYDIKSLNDIKRIINM